MEHPGGTRGACVARMLHLFPLSRVGFLDESRQDDLWPLTPYPLPAGERVGVGYLASHQHQRKKPTRERARG